MKPWETDPVMQEKATQEKAFYRSDDILSTIQSLMNEHPEQVERMLKEEDDQRMLEYQRAADTELTKVSQEEQDNFIEQFNREREEQARIMGSITDLASRRQTVDLQMAAERGLQRRSYGDQDRILSDIGLMKASRVRQDRILEQLRQRKLEKKRAAAGVESLQDLEKQLRLLRPEERKVGAAATRASDAGKRVEYEKLDKQLEILFKQREGIFEKIKKKNPKRADELYDELYLGQ